MELLTITSSHFGKTFHFDKDDVNNFIQQLELNEEDDFSLNDFMKQIYDMQFINIHGGYSDLYKDTRLDLFNKALNEYRNNVQELTEEEGHKIFEQLSKAPNFKEQLVEAKEDLALLETER